MTKKERIKVWKEINTVKLRENMLSGLDIYSIEGFTEGKEYVVFGLVWYEFDDHSGDFCYLIKDDNNCLRPIVITHFEIIN